MHHSLIKRFLILYLFCVVPVFAQSNTGELRLSVKDPSGLAVRSSVELISEANQFRQSYETDDTGNLFAKRLAFGIYLVKIEQPGFAPFAASVEVRSAIPKEFTARLSIAGSNSSVVVTGEETLVDPHRTGTINRIGSDVIDNQPVEMVDITDNDNRVVTVYFQLSTKLPVRQVTGRRDPKTKELNEEVTVYTKYRDVGGGVMWPFSIQRERNGEKLFEIFSESVKINQNLTDNMFTLPSNMKIIGGPKKKK